MDKLYIVIPAYNEEQAIGTSVKQWHEVVERVGGESRLLILNDGSKDGTWKILESLKSNFPFLEIINKPNSGHGPTCLFGYKVAIEKGASFIFQTDSDGQTDPGDFEQFWKNRHQHDFVIGFRTSRGDGIFRWVASRVLRGVIFGIFRVYVKDANVPFRLMKADALKKHLGAIPDNFFLANALLPVLFTQGNEKILWLKVNFTTRIGGVPSVSFRKFFKVGLRVIKDFYNFRNNKKNA